MSNLDIDSSQIGDDKPVVTQTSHLAGKTEEQPEQYRISWRTIVGITMLSLSWSSTTWVLGAPNTAIAYMVASFPGEEGNATWIANASLFCIVIVPVIAGTLSDRYGKKWFIVIGEILSVCGALVSGRASSVNMIIGGQALSGVGAAAGLVAVAASMEVVPVKYRPLSVGCMSILNSAIGAIAGPVVYAACVQHDLGSNGEGWRYGFYIAAAICGLGAIGVFFGYHPPPTRFRREQTLRETLLSVDFLGIFLLALGASLLVVSLVWGGNKYAWSNAHVISLLVISPVILTIFGIYEWKGRIDGLVHHEFFSSINFPILMVVGMIDGILLYAAAYFIPNEIRALYYTKPLDIISLFVPYTCMVLLGSLTSGILVTKMRKLRPSLITSCVLTTLLCGLMIRCNPGNKSYFLGIVSCLGLMTAAITVVPVAGIALVVPSYLLGTSNNLLACVRGLGGAIGIAIATAVYHNKIAGNLSTYVVPILVKAGLPSEIYSEILTILLNAPQALAKVPHISPQLVEELVAATATANAQSYKYVWVCITAAAGACSVASLFLKDVPERMTDEVESALEISKIREKQDMVV